MKNIISLIVVAISLITVGDAYSYMWYTNPANNHKYALTLPGNWTACENEAVTAGGHLVTINNADEENWIKNTFDMTTYY